MTYSIYRDVITEKIIPIGNGEYISILDWIMQEIESDGTITVSAKNIKSLIVQNHPEFKYKYSHSIINSLKPILKRYNIIIKTSAYNNDMCATMYKWN